MLLGVDADEVLWALLPSFLEYHNFHYRTSYNVSDFTTYSYREMLGREAQERYLAFHASGARYHVTPIDGASEALLKIRRTFVLSPIVITSRLTRFEQETCYLLNCHFPAIFSQVHFGNHFGELSRTKSQMCKEVGVTCLIEDQLGHALECAAQGIHVLLFGEYPWNRPRQRLPSNVVPVATWQNVLRELEIS